MATYTGAVLNYQYASITTDSNGNATVTLDNTPNSLAAIIPQAVTALRRVELVSLVGNALTVLVRKIPTHFYAAGDITNLPSGATAETSSYITTSTSAATDCTASDSSQSGPGDKTLQGHTHDIAKEFQHRHSVDMTDPHATIEDASYCLAASETVDVIIIYAYGWAPPASLKAYWKFNNSLLDSSGNGMDLTNAGSGNDSSGKLNQARAFTGALYAYRQMPLLMSETSDFTIECWIKTTTTQVQQIYYSGYYTGVYRCVDLYTVTGFVGIEFRTGVSNYKGFVSATTINDGLWHHVAVTHAADGTRHFYVDGVADESKPFSSGTLSGNFYNNVSDNIWLSREQRDVYRWVGSIDDMRIWNVVRTQTQIQNNKDIENPT